MVALASRVSRIEADRVVTVSPAIPPDPIAFARACGLEPDPWQAEVLRSQAPEIILNCTRQAGKSTVTSVLALHEALIHPPALVLLLSPGLRQSQELLAKVKQNLRHFPLGSARVEYESETRLRFTTGARIVSLPGTEATIRGFSGVRLLIVDEAARVPDELYYAIRPMLAVSRGRIILLSSPFGRRGFFHSEWEKGEGWYRVRVDAYQCPRIDRRWLDGERAKIGDWWFEQEYLCEFKDTTDQVFSSRDIDRAMSDDVKPLYLEGIDGPIAATL